MRLMWALQNIPELQEAAQSGNAVFGGVDCWLLYKLTGNSNNFLIIMNESIRHQTNLQLIE